MNAYQKRQAEYIKSCYIVWSGTTENIELGDTSFLKSETEVLLEIFDELEKSEDNSLEKSMSSKIHKYISKIGDKYIYEQPREIKPINEHRQYLKDKTSLDSIASNVNNAKWSLENRDSYKQYNKLKKEFSTKYGHDHDSEEAEHTKRSTVAAMHNHINNRVKDIETKQQAHVLVQEKELELQKAEGSRGGKIIGHTSTGKPIYEKHEQSHTQHYTAEDHSDAMSAHMKESSRYGVEEKSSDKHRKYHEDRDNHYEALKHAREGDEYSEKQKHHASMAELHSNAMNQKLDKNMNKSEELEILGHTRSGKPVYNSSDVELYKGYSVVDHKEAAVIHTLLRDKFEAEAFRSGTQVLKSKYSKIADDHLNKAEAHNSLAEESEEIQKSDSERGFVTTLSTGKKLHADPYSDFNKGFSREEHLEAAAFYKSQRTLLPTVSSEVTKRANIHLFLMDKNIFNKSEPQDLGEDSLIK